MKVQCFCLATALGLALSTAGAAEIDSNWKIVVPKTGTALVDRWLGEAAKLLQRDLAEGAGLKLEIAKETPATGPAILLGADCARAAGLGTDGLRWFDNVIAEKGGRLYLYGNDRARRPDYASDEWYRAQLPTFSAVTRFLHDYLGDRFCMPGETGRHVGRREKVVVPDGTRSVARPTMIYEHADRRDIVYSYGAGMRGMGLFHSYGGHTYPAAVTVAKYAKTHPEYFAMTPEGRRTWQEEDGHNALCISNPEVEELIVAELLKRYDDGAEVCQLAQQDGADVCHCEKCRAMYGTGEDWGEKFWCFHRHIAERIEKLRPGKIVQILSYCLTEKPPKSFRKFPSNVMVEMCRYSEEAFAAWKGYEVPQGFTVYVYFWGNHPQPGFVAKHSFAFLADNARRFVRNNVKGIFRCGYGDLYGLEGPAYHVFNELLTDPEQPVDGLVADYCRSMFGPAATAMQRFYDVQDARLRGIDLIRTGLPASCGNGLGRYLAAGTKMNGDLHAWAYSPDTVKTMEELLETAEGTAGLSEKEKRRLDLVRREFDYAKSMGKVAYLYGAYRFSPTPATFDALADALEERQKAILGLSDGKGGAIKLPGWPELAMLDGAGYYGGTRWLQGNGRLSATMGAPLSWDMKRLKARGALPGLTMMEKKVARAAAEPTLDDLIAGTGAWAKAEETKLTGVQGEENMPETTKFRLLYGDRFLYVGVRTDLPAKTNIRSFDPDGPLWETEYLDFFLAPGKTVDVHYHLLWTPESGSRLDLAFGLITEPLDPLYNQSDVRWNGKWSHDDRRIGDTWYSVLKVPYADLGCAVPKPGEVWRLNLGRSTNPEHARAGERNYIWSVNLFNNHLDYPDAMGRVVFE